MRINPNQFIFSICVAAFLAGCATNPPPLPLNNPADPQVRGSSKRPRDVLARDEITLAIEKELSATQVVAESAEKMPHDMQNMPGMRHGGMKMEGQNQLQHGDMHGHEAMRQQKNAESEKKALADEMKKTSEEMKTGASIYTCPMHPEVRSEKPGECQICGMKLINKEGAHESH